MQELNTQIANRLNFNYLDKTLASESFDDGFHLPKSVSAIADMYKCETESIASSATSKRRIDMLFGETRSVSSEYHINHRKYDLPDQQRKVRSLIEGGVCNDDDDDNNLDDGDHFYQKQQQVAQNDVQVQIEKMFSEISSSEQEMETQQPRSYGTNRFTIQHLGSIPVHGKILSVDGLQEPLKELFFKYQHQRNKKNTNGVIQIGDKGLQIEYCSNYGGRIEKLYSFSNIAIWASLKFSHRTTTTTTTTTTTSTTNAATTTSNATEDKNHNNNGQQQQLHHEYAFLPIVTNSDKSSLYAPLPQQLVHHFIDTDNVPLFAVVMREPDTLVKQLVCHGFVCHSSEDAVIMAATLYRVLMSKLSKTRAAKSRIPRRRTATTSTTTTTTTTTIKPVVLNRLCSIGETSPNEAAELECDNYAQVEKQPTASASSSLAVSLAESAAALSSVPPPPLPPTRPPRKLKQLTKQHRKATSDDALRPAAASERRDVLTKIAIPRSGSFLNTNRLGSRYYADAKPSLATEPSCAHKATASPLGFVEMFNELQSQEGLKTIDEILRVIIKSEGMSFNELKPIYKEFLLKLALVLSKDELYHRSKAIMKSQQKKYNASAPLSSSSSSSHLKKMITTKAGLKNVFRKPLVKLRMRKKPKDGSGSGGGGGACLSCQKHGSDEALGYDDGTSTDSFMLTDKVKLHQDLKLDRPSVTAMATTTSFSSTGKVNGNLASVRQKPFRFRSQHRITSTSEDSDYPNVNQRKFKNRLQREDALRPSSSGYFSFSECSYDTESCTCVSADKCYCSLNKNKLMARSKPKTNYSTCSCDTIACRKRNKCYCSKLLLKHQRHQHQQHELSLVEQLKQKGFVVSESSLSPEDTNKKTPVKDRSNTKLSKSLEYLESGSHKYKNRMELYDASGQKAFPCRHSYKYSPTYSSECSSRTSQKRSVSSDNLAVDYSMFAKSEERSGREAATAPFAYRSPKRMSARKQNVVYAELARPKLGTHSTSPIDQNYVISSPLMPPVRMESPSMLNGVYSHTPMRTCNCACACRMFAGEPFSTYGSTPFGGMNMENIFGYFP